MSRRCRNGMRLTVERMSPTYPRTIGEMVRQARDEGVLPDMDTVPGAFDDDEDMSIDPHSNPRTDPMEILEASEMTRLSSLRDAQSAPAAPAASAEPAAPAVPSE